MWLLTISTLHRENQQLARSDQRTHDPSCHLCTFARPNWIRLGSRRDYFERESLKHIYGSRFSFACERVLSGPASYVHDPSVHTCVCKCISFPPSFPNFWSFFFACVCICRRETSYREWLEPDRPETLVIALRPEYMTQLLTKKEWMRKILLVEC